ncbi:MAG: chemotaxis protein CheX [Gammaproteobacteria bacterium]|nr:MAG: chemotaxis protein CheX [Gammaproteobacteria bacterium]
MNVNHINPFIEATASVLETMVGISVEPQGNVALKLNCGPLGAITGIIPLESDANRGSFAISFSEPAILGITHRLLGDEVTEIDDSVVDAVGELTNMVAGGAKAKLVDNGFDFDLTRPKVIQGDVDILHPYEGPTIFLMFDTSVGDLALEICFEQRNWKRKR